MKTLAVTAALGTLFAGTTVLAPPAQADATCRGVAATIVGTPDGDLMGTHGNDVVVTHGAQLVDTGDGDDLVCVTGHSSRTPHVATGPGDDVVDTRSADQLTVFSHLGVGSDTLLGGTTRDFVYAGIGYREDIETDTLRSGAGDDVIASGEPDHPNADRIHSGSGDDVVRFLGIQSGGRVTAGRGTDTLNVNITSKDPVSTFVDVGSRRVARDGVTLLRWEGSFTTYEIVGNSDDESWLTFDGSGRRDDLVLGHLGRPTVIAHLRGGDDRLDAPFLNYAPDTTFAGGPGVDSARLNLWPNGFHHEPELLVDLEDHIIDHDTTTVEPDAIITGFAHVTAGAADLTISGDSHDNVLVAVGCAASVSGSAGPDVLLARTVGSCKSRSFHLFGNAGADRLVGGQFADLLRGGPGRDRADGRGGRDTCQAEVTRNCERS